MFKIILGLSIVLAILLLTVFVLSIQHITFKDTKNTKNTKDTKDTKNTYDDTDEENKLVGNIQPSAIETDEDEDGLTNPLHHKEPKEQKCCSVQKFDCGNNKLGCVSGVEKRCGIFAQKPCEEPMYSCEVLDKDTCVSYPSNMYCEYDTRDKMCVSTTINSHGGSEIPCDTFNTFVNDHNYPNTKYNCENNLFAF